MASPDQPGALVRFYRGGPDDRGRTLEPILAWDRERLEAVHD